MHKTLDSAHSQMGAVVGKLMDTLERTPEIQAMHPLDFDRLRRTVIASLWESYNVGFRANKDTSSER